MKILLDTNILLEEGLQSRRMQLLQRLIKSGHIELIIPEIVVKEYKTKLSEISKNEIDKISRSTDELIKKSIVSEDTSKVRRLVDIYRSYTNKVELKVDDWLSINNVNVFPIANTSIETLFDNYFLGKGAFENKKSRKDIPDAVIYDSIVQLSKNNTIHVYAKDGVLFNSINNFDNVKAYKSLKDLFENKKIKSEIELLDNNDKHVKSILSVLNDSSLQLNIEEYISKYKVEEVSSYDCVKGIKFPIEIQELELEDFTASVYEVNEVLLMKPTYLGNDNFSYELIINCEIDFLINTNIETYEALPYKFRKKLPKAYDELKIVNNLVYASGGLSASFNGVVILKNIGKIDANQLKVHLSYLASDQCEIECEVTLESLEIDDI